MKITQAEKINWYGTMCLTEREVRRFIRVYHQTILTPVVSALIFLAVFVLAIGGTRHDIAGIKFINFMGYGLIIMSIVQNAFANSSSSFVMGKVIGYIIDIMVPPLGSTEIIIAYTVGATIRGILVGIMVSLALSPFVDYHLLHPLLMVYFVVSSCFLLGQLGILAGIVSKSFDHFSAFTSYIVTPLSFLSGTFYSVKDLHFFFQVINYLNPFFYMIDGFRFCLTNHTDSNVIFGMGFMLIINVLIYSLLRYLLDKGWNLKG